MWFTTAKNAADTHMEKAWRVTLPGVDDGEAEVYGFDESQLDPKKCVLAHTSAGDFNVENDVGLAFYLDKPPATPPAAAPAEEE